MMSIYWSRSFPRSNSSFLLCSGNASQSYVLRLRLREEMFLVDAGLGTPKICMQDELTGLPIKRATRFENKVGSKNVVAGESLIKKRIFERFFIDLVAGESLIKERAAARFNDFVGSLDVAAGEPLLLPQRFRQNRAWIELKKIWRTNKKVKGFKIKKIKGGYSVAIAGFITFLPWILECYPKTNPHPNYPFPLCRVRKKMDLPCVGLRMFRIRGPIPIRII
ncbi:hypothetical protein HU200_008248 [Digitaria exilis]|uniref:Ribosomal protein S1 n=1 Tax=Digitaria exilis TaxID=1010633 RepID=A0A835FN59_9POAL|nr:hypothetical protein HU200_008248 [Digitaria exilis]